MEGAPEGRLERSARQASREASATRLKSGMQTFFADMNALERFTLDLRSDPSLRCPHCKCEGQLISHGFVYKKRQGAKRQAVGKRIFCSNRQGRRGCGRTKRLYLGEDIPALQYGTRHLLVFIMSLLSLKSIQRAYQEATGTREARNAARWIGKLWLKLAQYRGFLKARNDSAEQDRKFSTGRLQRLLPTIDRLLMQTGTPCRFQLCQQVSFL